ncbi:hypothetical protein bcgnr5390_51770 [Bacillus luti]|uniref:SMI1/KNR4 family protein n=1 Tax=Bacillus luti TaxID=2026191 RepID=UPI00289D3783|nr:SMI1/KNR4 family protein [Bacillus luti]
MENIRDLIPTKKPGVNLLDINLTEQKLGVIFPEQYRGLIQLVNNAEIGEWTLFPIKDYKNVKKTWDDIVRQNNEVRDERMPNNLIAIGDDGSGDKLCLKKRDKHLEDAVYLWNHETNAIEKYTSDLWGFINLIADDFE